MIIGFTGTRLGMSIMQKRAVDNIIKVVREKIIEVHHGCCVGADEEFHNICLRYNLNIIIHPPIIETYMANLSGNKREPLDYLERNKKIVEESDLIIATPYEDKPKKKGGTWYTIRYAKRMKKRLIIISPNGDFSNSGSREKGECDVNGR